MSRFSTIIIIFMVMIHPLRAEEVVTGEQVFQQWYIHCHGEDNSGPGTLRLAWDKAMASALNTGLFHAAPAKKQVITTTMSRPASSPDYLVTWGILHLNDKASEKLWDEEVERRYY